MNVEQLTAWGHLGLEWVGFGTVIGLLAKALMPGKDPGGPLATFVLGILGVVFGCGTLSLIWHDASLSPLSPAGFVVGTIGAFILLGFYRLLAPYRLNPRFDSIFRRLPTLRRSTKRRSARVVVERD